jgi:hypothetical protein
LILLLVVLAILIFSIILLFSVPLKVDFTLDTDNTSIKLDVLWLYPFAKALVTMKNSKPVLDLYILKWHMLKEHSLNMDMNKGSQLLSRMDYLRAINPDNVQVCARYGFSNPFGTGITCGAVNLVSQLIDVEFIENEPDFRSEEDYLYIDATASILPGPAIVRIFKQKLNRRDSLWIRTQT